MTTRSQKTKAVAEVVSTNLETHVAESIQFEDLVAGSSTTPRIHPETLDENKMSRRKEMITDPTKIVAENQKEMPKLIAPVTKNLLITGT